MLAAPKGYQQQDNHPIQLCQTLADMQHTCEWLVAVNTTPWARMACGLQRRHMKGSCRAHHTLSVDLTGPHPPALGTGATYGLVGVYTVDLGDILPFVVGVKTKNAEECAHGILKIIKMVTWMSDG